MKLTNTDVQKVVVRMPNWLGDAVMATPILQDLKMACPHIELVVLCHEAIHNLLQHNPYIDDFIVFSKELKRISKEKKRIFSLLQQKSFDLGIVVTRSFSSAWWLYKGGVKERIGFKDHFRSPLLTVPLALPKNEETEHAVCTYKRLLSPLGISISDSRPELFLHDDERERAKKLLHAHGVEEHHIVVGINPGAAFGSSKCWPKERFIALTKRLEMDPDVRVVFVGDKMTKALVDSICDTCSEKTVNLATKTDLRTLIAFIAQTACFVSNDSGPMHVAAATSAPLVALFGSTNEIKTGPYGDAQVIHKHTLCSPCYLKQCPIDFRCMTSISVDEVYSATTMYLKKYRWQKNK